MGEFLLDAVAAIFSPLTVLEASGEISFRDSKRNYRDARQVSPWERCCVKLRLVLLLALNKQQRTVNFKESEYRLVAGQNDLCGHRLSNWHWRQLVGIDVVEQGDLGRIEGATNYRQLAASGRANPADFAKVKSNRWSDSHVYTTAPCGVKLVPALLL